MAGWHSFNIILFVSTLIVIWLVSYIDLLSMTKRKRTAAQFFDDAETHGLEPLMKTDLNDEKVSTGLGKFSDVGEILLIMA